MLWVHDDDQLPQAEGELAKFLSDPAAHRYAQAEGQAARLRKEEAQANARAAKRQVDVRTQVFGQSTLRTPHLTYGLIGLCVLIFLMLQSDAGASLRQTLSITSFKFQGHMVSWQPGLPDILKGEVWRLFSPAFLHFGFLHIIFNMMWLNELGKAFEQKHGAFRLIAFVVLAGIFSNLFQYADIFSSLFGRGPTFGGMSGVVYALAGYCWVRGQLTPHDGIGLAPETMRFLMIWFAVCFLPFLPIANGAHAGGLAVGLGIGWLAARRAR